MYNFFKMFFIFSEKDCNGVNLFTWGYPAVTESQKTIVTRKYNLQSEKSNGLSFVFSRHQNEWFYIYCSDILESNTLPKVSENLKLKFHFLILIHMDL